MTRIGLVGCVKGKDRNGSNSVGALHLGAVSRLAGVCRTDL
jgi:hypothetical protein